MARVIAFHPVAGDQNSASVRIVGDVIVDVHLEDVARGAAGSEVHRSSQGVVEPVVEHPDGVLAGQVVRSLTFPDHLGGVTRTAVAELGHLGDPVVRLRELAYTIVVPLGIRPGTGLFAAVLTGCHVEGDLIAGLGVPHVQPILRKDAPDELDLVSSHDVDELAVVEVEEDFFARLLAILVEDLQKAELLAVSVVEEFHDAVFELQHGSLHSLDCWFSSVEDTRRQTIV